MKLDALKKTNFHCSFSECHKQAWLHNSEWTEYKHNARPSYAFILICSDMKMKFYLQNGKSFVAQKGDIVFVPFIRQKLYALFDGVIVSGVIAD